MTQIELWYNPYMPELKVLIDSRALSPYSTLMQYRHTRIFDWIGVLFSDLYREIQDDYVVRCFTTEFCGEWISYMADHETHCKEFIWQELPLKRNGFERLAMLEMLGFDESRELVIPVYCEQGEEISNAVFDILKEQGSFVQDEEDSLICTDCSLVNIRLKKAAGLYTEEEDFPMMLSVYGEYGDIRPVSRGKLPVYALFCGSRNGFEGLVGKQIVFMMDSDNLTALILNLIEEQVLCSLLSDWVHQYSEKEKAFLTREETDELRMLCQAAPICWVELPDEIFLGREFEIRVMQLPPDSTQKVSIRSGAPEILEVQGNFLVPHREGYSEVAVYQSFDPYPVHKKIIYVKKKLLIRELELFPKLLYLPEWGKGCLKLTCIPAEAENTNEICWTSSDPMVATVNSLGEISAGTGGFCKIRAATAEADAVVTVQVQPRVQKIIMSCTEITLRTGERFKWKYQVVPANAYGADLIIPGSTAPEVADYRGGCIIARNSGSCQILLSMMDGEVVGRVSVYVKK